MIVKCSKQKIVTKSSTEAELVTLSDAVSLAAYSVNFSKAQGYDVSATLMQDNSTLILGVLVYSPRISFARFQAVFFFHRKAT